MLRCLRWLTRGVFLTAAVGLGVDLAACAHHADAGPDGAAEDLTQHRPLVVDEDISVLVEHPDTLRELEAAGFDLGSKLTGTKLADNTAFAASPAGGAVLAAVKQDVRDAMAADKELGVGMTFDHRAFDATWLTLPQARFELVGVTNRLDKRAFAPDGCGEVHVVYRLAYSNKETTSRLPMTLMLVYPQPKTGPTCADVATKWTAAHLPSSAPAKDKAAALVSGPLAGLGLAPRVELNFQLVRWPSSTRQDLGGHAEYSMRIFARSTDGSDAVAPVPLDNTVRADLAPDEQAVLAKWIGENLPAIDRGTAKMPEELEGKHLLAEHAISVSPKGLARGQNRPFALAFGKDGSGLAGLTLPPGLPMLKSKAALVRRLDTMTCEGCHQSQGIAGFHLVGHDRPEIPDMNALVEGVSPHLREQLAYRKKDLAQAANGATDVAPVPFAERAVGSGVFAKEGGYGAVCGLGDPGFGSWTCAHGLTCANTDGDDVGMCVTAGPTRPAGEACEEVHTTFDADSHEDSSDKPKVIGCSIPSGQAGHCVHTSGGFPNGMCSGACGTVGRVQGDAICGVSAPSGFNVCILDGGAFTDCSAHGAPELRRACSTNAPCGQDYVCGAVTGAPAGVGACTPTYFVFQVRIDGHNVEE